MDEEEYHLRFMETARRYGMLGVQIMHQINERQNALDLQSVLNPAQLNNESGLLRSRETLNHLLALIEASEQAYGQFVGHFTEEMGKLAAQAPEAAAAELSKEVLPVLEEQLNTQIHFFHGRRRWIAAVQQLIDFLTPRLDSVRFTPSGMEFESDEEVNQWTALTDIIDEVHEKEVSLFHERVARIQRSAALLGFRVN